MSKRRRGTRVKFNTNFNMAVQGLMSRKGRLMAQKTYHKRFKPSKLERFSVRYFKKRGISKRKMDKLY